MRIGRIYVLIIFALLAFSQFAEQTQFAKAGGGYYRDYATFIASFTNLTAQYPSLATYEPVGKTVQGNDIIMFKIGNPAANTVLIDGAIHGDETLGSELLYFYAQWLLSSNDSLANQILAHTYTLLIPAVNVDNYNMMRVNAHHVDLNRNFATNWQNGGSTDPSSWYYRGPAPLSEPESQTIVRVLQTYNPRFYVNLHFAGGSYYLGSIYGDQAYYQSLVSKINLTSQDRNVPPYPYYCTSGPGFAMSDAARLGITSFLIELTSNTSIPLLDIKTAILPKFMPIAAVLSQEGESVFEDNFESSSFNAWSGNQTTSGETMSVTDNLSREGSQSAFFSSSGNDASEAAYCYKNIGPQTTLYARGYFAVTSSLATANHSIFYFAGFAASGEDVAMVGCKRSGDLAWWRLAVKNNSDWVIVDSPANEFSNQWHRYEFQWVQSPQNGYGGLHIDDKLVCSISEINTTAYGAVDTVKFGIVLSGNTKTACYLDCVQVSSSSLGPLPIPADLNEDYVVDLRDAVIFAVSYNTIVGSSKWNPRADLNLDGKANLQDFVNLAYYYGKKID